MKARIGTARRLNSKGFLTVSIRLIGSGAFLDRGIRLDLVPHGRYRLDLGAGIANGSRDEPMPGPAAVIVSMTEFRRVVLPFPPRTRIMRWICRSLALAVATVGLFGLVGCGEDNEKTAGNGEAITKPANAPTPEEYQQAMQKANAGGAQGPGAGSNIPGTPPPPNAATP